MTYQYDSHRAGGWGDPNNDFQTDSGRFKDEAGVYPNPHYIKRNYSLYPLSNPNTLPPWGNAPDSLPRQVTGGRTKANDSGLVADRSSHSRPTLNLSM